MLPKLRTNACDTTIDSLCFERCRSAKSGKLWNASVANAARSKSPPRTHRSSTRPHTFCQSYENTCETKVDSLFFERCPSAKSGKLPNASVVNATRSKSSPRTRRNSPGPHTFCKSYEKTRVKQKLTIYYSSVVDPQNPESSGMRAL